MSRLPTRPITSARRTASRAKLLRPGEPPEQLEPLLTFLMFHQLADISPDGGRVWLNSDFRRVVERLG